MITEQIFKNVLNMVWRAVSTSMGLINTLEYIGIDVNDNADRAHPEIVGFSSLYDLQSKAIMTILNVLEIKPDAKCESNDNTILEELDQFFSDFNSECYGYDTFPEDVYDDLLELLRRYTGKLPWENTDTSSHTQSTKNTNQEQTKRLDRLSESEKALYLEGDKGLKPYLRMADFGMPKNKINQIAWLLLNGGGCGFCKICRDEACHIKDGEKCTSNIADYIRDIVHKEDAEKIK